MASIVPDMITPKVEARFWRQIDRRDPENCWPWAGQDNGRRGEFRINGKRFIATHVALALVGKFRPEKAFALHACDNQACCNPAHLRWGSQADNIADKVARGRCAVGERHGSRTKPERLARGERNGSYTKPEKRPRGDSHYSRISPERRVRGSQVGTAKLTESDVRAIRASTLNQKVTAKLFGISQANVSAIVTRQTWAHVT